MSKKRTHHTPQPWALTDFGLQDVAEVEMQADPHRLYFGFRLMAGPTIWLHVIHDADGFRVYVDSARSSQAVLPVKAPLFEKVSA